MSIKKNIMQNEHASTKRNLWPSETHIVIVTVLRASIVFMGLTFNFFVYGNLFHTGIQAVVFVSAEFQIPYGCL